MKAANLVVGTLYLLNIISSNSLTEYTVLNIITGLDSVVYIQLSNGNWVNQATFDATYAIIYAFSSQQ